MNIKLVVLTSISTTGRDTLQESAREVYGSKVGTMCGEETVMLWRRASKEDVERRRWGTKSNSARDRSHMVMIA